ncbi:hypothetical protein BDK51DRAFT_32427 [Blyttiomyces helicus]|uniref:Uncharacterized protein n=1 Tax=Blyttiomyces helicus TaxID=388810 RepID=A0A4P9VZU8_9FUNG|nr:hypothetical protein BDK51DRAFT_32427 [Blyttiomyces helicus]|eukprot:RKO85361.1 hypothetical protein BDK51DRAFT_32427 [Blyttiomyces helicus]
MLHLLFLSDALATLLPSDRLAYSNALLAISLDVEEACREPNPAGAALETVFEVPVGIDPVRLCRKAMRRVGRCDINQGLRVVVGHCKLRNAVVCRVAGRSRVAASPGAPLLKIKIA